MRLVTTLDADGLRQARALMDRAFDDFTDADWAHTLGGRRAALLHEGRVVAHAAVVERVLTLDGVPHRVGYVEAVAVDPPFQGRGLGTRVMQGLDLSGFDFCALSTGEHRFYEGLGWQRWQGTTEVEGRPTPDEDDGIMVLGLDRLTGRLGCRAREGDDW